MIPLKLVTRSIARSATLLLTPRPHAAFRTAVTSLSMESYCRTISPLVAGMNSLLKSRPYSTETHSPKLAVETPLEADKQSPPPSSTASEKSLEEPQLSKSKRQSDTTQGSSSSRQEATESTEKVQPDKLYRTIEIEVLSYEPAVLDSYQWFVLTAASHLGINVGKCWSPMKSDKQRFELLKSAFVHKKHQVHYEIRTYHRFLTFHKLTGSTADTFLEYIERNIPEGVGMKVTRIEVQPLPDYVQKK